MANQEEIIALGAEITAKRDERQRHLDEAKRLDGETKVLMAKLAAMLGSSTGEQPSPGEPAGIATAPPPPPSIKYRIELWLNEHPGNQTSEEVCKAFPDEKADTVRSLLSRLAGEQRIRKVEGRRGVYSSLTTPPPPPLTMKPLFPPSQGRLPSLQSGQGGNKT